MVAIAVREPLASVGVAERTPTALVRVGDTVVAEDGVLGRVDRVIRSEAKAPVFVVVSVGRFLRRKYPVLPLSFVSGVDRSRKLVQVRGRCAAVRRLPETLPFVL
jgi:hypothetical protein